MNRKTASTAIQIAHDLDRIAEVIRKQGSAMGLPSEVVRDFQARCASVSAIVAAEVGGSWDATQIGGPRKVQMVEPSPEDAYMHSHFDVQDEFYELGDLVDASARVASKYLRRNR